jgi:hypothetical protein
MQPAAKQEAGIGLWARQGFAVLGWHASYNHPRSCQSTLSLVGVTLPHIFSVIKNEVFIVRIEILKKSDSKRAVAFWNKRLAVNIALTLANIWTPLWTNIK